MKKLLLYLACSLLSLTGWAQITVTGTVFDEYNETVPMAIIRLKSNPKVATATSNNGQFTITVPSARSVLTVTYMGYETQEVAIGQRRQLRIELKPMASLMQETVVVGFGTQKKVNLTGAVKTVGDEVFADRPLSNAVQGLQGAIGGLNITNDAGGGLGEEMQINIRGIGSIGEGSNSSPLILIDGMEGDLSTINPADIESVSVLKDGASASIYGSRAPFGVILVTTKSGSRQGVNVNYTNNFRIQQPMSVPKMVDSYTYALMVNEASQNSGGNPLFGSGIMDRILDYQNGKLDYSTMAQDPFNWWGTDNSFGNTDWYDLYIKKFTTSMENNVTVSGKQKKLDYYASLGYLSQTGLFRYADEEYNRLSGNVKLGYQFNKYVKLTLNSRLINIDNNKPSVLNELFYHNLGRRGPTTAITLPNGEYSKESMLPAIINGGRIDQKTHQYYNQANLVIEPVKDWKIHAEVNSRLERNPYTRDLNPVGCHAPNGTWTYFPVCDGMPSSYKLTNNDIGWFRVFPGAGDQYNETAKTRINYFGTNVYTDYNLKLKRHKMTFLIGEQSEYYHRKINREATHYNVEDAVPDIQTMSAFRNGKWTSLGFFARINYSFADRYLLEVNARADGASRFPRDQRWGYFPSVSAGWNIGEEPFWKKLHEKGLEYLKLRGSYATLGNQNTTSFYPYYQKMETSNSTLVINGVQATTLPMFDAFSTSLTWETIENAGAGLDFAFFNNRLTGSFDWYQRKTKDMVGPANALSALYGTSAPKTNNAELRTRGWEVELGWRDRIGKNFSYSISGTLSDYQTIITKYDSPDKNINGWYEGKKYGEIWGYEVIGIAQSDKEMADYLAQHSQSAIGDRWGGGDLMYRDLNNDGAVNAGSRTLDDHGDLKIIGNSTPRFAYSFTATAQWKWIDLRAYFQGIGKRDYFFNTATFFGMVGAYQRSIYLEHLDYFRYAGSELGANYENPYYPRLRADGNNTQTSDRYLQNASYLRLKNLQIGFNLPKKNPNSKFIKKARLYVSGENLLTWTKLRIYDPESINAKEGDYDGGAGKTYPQYRTFSMGVEIQL